MRRSKPIPIAPPSRASLRHAIASLLLYLVGWKPLSPTGWRVVTSVPRTVRDTSGRSRGPQPALARASSRPPRPPPKGTLTKGGYTLGKLRLAASADSTAVAAVLAARRVPVPERGRLYPQRRLRAEHRPGDQQYLQLRQRVVRSRRRSSARLLAPEDFVFSQFHALFHHRSCRAPWDNHSFPYATVDCGGLAFSEDGVDWHCKRRGSWHRAEARSLPTPTHHLSSPRFPSHATPLPAPL